MRQVGRAKLWGTYKILHKEVQYKCPNGCTVDGQYEIRRKKREK